MKKEVDFQEGSNGDKGEVYNLDDIDPEDDLGVEVIEEVPDTDPQEQFDVTFRKRKEDTRERLAVVFVIGLFITLIVASVIGFIAEEGKVQNIIDLVLALSGVLSGPLGFIIGYYFKRQEEYGE